MALSPGSRVGVYDIIAQIGEGGMGQVYRARDTKLDRDVAIKILPDAFARDADRLARFRREAKTLASLNHPHIAGIYGLDEGDGVSALVMELVEGEDLSQRIGRGAIPLDEALPIARQITDALEAAHEQGIIHRDLKPANIKVRVDGTVKVLDFGLAKAMETGGAGPAGGAGRENQSMSPTIMSPASMSGVGVILGTAAYMAPEQARGTTLDKRADLWAFGVVLWEMLTGKRLFEGATVSDTLAAVLKSDPDWTTLPAATPAPLRRLLRRCLEKDRKRRLDSAAAARLEIDEASAAPSSLDSPGLPTTDSRPSARQSTLSWAIAGVGLLAAGVLLMLWAPWRAETLVDRPLVRLDVDLGTDVSLPVPNIGGSSVVLSPDGTRLVYLSGTPAKLFTRRLDQPNATELPGTLRASAPFFSPDGRWVGFFSGSTVNKISVDGGALVPLLGDIAVVGGASWDEDGSILVSDATGRGLLRVPAGGGPPQAILGRGEGDRGLVFPQTLPGGKAILFVSASGNPDTNTIEVLTLADRHRKIVARGGQSVRYLAASIGAGYLVYNNKATLFAIPFDLATLETRGSAVPVLDDLAYEAVTSTGHFAVTRTGTLIHRRTGGVPAEMTTLDWVDPTGKRAPLRATPGVYRDPSLSPDGTRVALTVTDGGRGDVWVYDAQRDVMTPLTFGGGRYQHPRWSPDGRFVVFQSAASTQFGIFQARADGASQPQALTQAKTIQIPWSFTPDGKRLAYSTAGETNQQIWTVPLEDQGGQLKAGTPEPFLKSRFNDVTPAFSPDGRWLAYGSDESGKSEIYVRAFPPPSASSSGSAGQGGQWQLSNSGGVQPIWSQQGQELLYLSRDQIMAASYSVKGDAFVADKPRVWLPKAGVATGTSTYMNTVAAGGSVPGMWDLAPDGKRAAVLTPVESAQAPTQEHEVVFLQNFFDELRRRVPLAK